MTEPSGYTALDLIGFTDKGEYNAATNYVRNDLAHVGNDVWRCLVDDTIGQTPAEGTYWTIFIENDSTADSVSYTNTTSGLTATDVQAAIDELARKKANSATTLSGYGITNAYTKTETDTLLSAKANSATSLSGYGITDAYTQTETDTLLDAKADQTVIGDEYNSATSYAAGDYFTYSGIRYKVKVACVGVTPPNANYYTATPIDDDMADLSSQISDLNTHVVGGYMYAGNTSAYTTVVIKSDTAQQLFKFIAGSSGWSMTDLVFYGNVNGGNTHYTGTFKGTNGTSFSDISVASGSIKIVMSTYCIFMIQSEYPLTISYE